MERSHRIGKQDETGGFLYRVVVGQEGIAFVSTKSSRSVVVCLLSEGRDWYRFRVIPSKAS